MPSFFPRYAGRTQVPLTPPEYGPHASSGNIAAMAYQQAHHTALQRNNIGFHGMHEQVDPRDYPAYTSTATDAFGKMLPILPPLTTTVPPTYGHTIAAESNYHPHYDTRTMKEQSAPAKTDKPVGGVAATLDYDMDMMTDFVAEMVHGIVQPHMNQNHTADPSWRKWVSQVLCATRLPSSTILLSLQYLTMRMQQLSRNGNRALQPAFQRQRMVTVAFILGSKFLDDNTFINRSWAEVSGIEVAVLNYMELDWFQAMDHCLHREPAEPQGFNSWLEKWKYFELNVRQQKVHAMKLCPIDTSVAFQRSVKHSYSIPNFHSKTEFARLPPLHEPGRHADANTYGQYDGTWLYPQSAVDNSPASLPHTGPTTPEYYASAGPIAAPWASNGGYSRRTMFGYPSVQMQIPAMSATLNAPLQEPSYQHLALYNSHQVSCQCHQCAYSPPQPYISGYTGLMQPLPAAA